MRMLPLALVEREIPDADLVEHAQRSSLITHAHTVSQVTCAPFSLIVPGFWRERHQGTHSQMDAQPCARSTQAMPTGSTPSITSRRGRSAPAVASLSTRSGRRGMR